MQTIETEVLISGAGPAGLSLAMELGARGIDCVVVEPQVEVNPHPRASLLGPRSMEYFRRHGIDQEILEAGLPMYLPYEVRFVRTLTGLQLHHWSVASHLEHGAMSEGRQPPTHAALVSPYGRVQIGQHRIEPVLRRRVAELRHVHMRYGWKTAELAQNADGVTASIESIHEQRGGDFERVQVRAVYAVACDGARSLIRRGLGIDHAGRGAIGRNRSFLVRSPELATAPGFARGNLHFVYTPGIYGVLTDLDDQGLYAYSHFAPGSIDAEGRDEDPREVMRAVIGADVPFEVLRVMEWWHHQSVANRFRAGRTFLAGDAAHLFCPSGGIGMNTAIADAFDLAWKLDAKLRGWGGEALLDSYERERWPVAVRNTLYSATNRDRLDAALEWLPCDVDAAGGAGDAARVFAAQRFGLLVRQFGSTGAHLGMRYNDSPVVVDDETPEPPDDPRVAIATTWPGSRAPHAWIAPQRSTLDLFDGSSFTLVATDAATAAESDAFVKAGRALGIPVNGSVLSGPVAELYERRWVLVRPDGHVAWRGDVLPREPLQLWRRVTGRCETR